MSRGYHLVTSIILREVGSLPEVGIMNVFVRHTSAGLTINENADPSVRVDFESFFNNIVPDGASYFTHTLEGEDDMSAHIKSSIVGSSLCIPITDGRLNLGTWQGIYFCEFRNYAGNRNLVVTVYS
jgi:secondary thiamine-phosphate synthase enzyme